LLASTPSANSQVFETVTATLTISTLFTPVVTSYMTTTGSGLVTGPVTIPATGPTAWCMFTSLPFSMNQSGHVTGRLTASSPFRFYIMRDAIYQKYYAAWLNPHFPGCSPEDGGFYAIVGVSVSQTYSFDFYLTGGNYDFVFYGGQYPTPSTAPPSHPSIHVDFQANTGQTTTTTMSQPAFSTTTQSILLTTALTTQLAQSSLFSSQNAAFIPVGLAVIVVLIVLIAVVLLYRRRRGGSRSVTRVYDPVVTVPVSRVDAAVPEATRTYARAETRETGVPFVTYCPQCGTENLSDSKFCRECARRINSPRN